MNMLKKLSSIKLEINEKLYKNKINKYFEKYTI